MQSSRYVKGYAMDHRKVAIHLQLTYCRENMEELYNADWSVMEFLREKSHITTGTAHMFAIARPLGSNPRSRSVRVISIGLEALSSDLDELTKKNIEYPKYLKELAEVLFSGPDIFEIASEEDPRV